MTLEITSSLQNLQRTVNHHFRHIQAAHPFARPIAVQYELAYTDYRVVQLALQLGEQPALNAELTAAYEAVQAFEWPFIAGGPAEFAAQHGEAPAGYAQAVATFDAVCARVAAWQGGATRH
ncbi:hypothetical protein [Lacticaseibacillus parakribbianus]|uniref:hypothetical protein n=1 Tax=Lacticaseibacillus parakribbianus TaxID=2970927 RepID=UPI0021CB1CE6|nr:hypothetical protein [Lacticaseibacillus parakribbianus]